MNLDELRSLNRGVKVKSKEESKKRELTVITQKETLLQKASIRHAERQKSRALKPPSALASGPFTLKFIAAASLCMISVAVSVIISASSSDTVEYTYGARTMDVSQGKERNASDFIRNIVLYADDDTMLQNFLSTDFPISELNKLRSTFSRLKSPALDINCFSATTEEDGRTAFGLECRSPNTSAILGLKLENSRFSITSILPTK